ncbi:MAG: hypothetical protein P8016_06195 [Sedimentisphaerales bacterium]
MAAAIVAASAFTTSRLYKALNQKNKSAKIKILTELTKTEIAAFMRLNEFCAKIFQSANALSRWTTKESLNVEIKGKRDAEQALRSLKDAEMGMQMVFNDYMSKRHTFKTMTTHELDEWTKKAIRKTCRISQSANKLARNVSEFI